MVGIVLAISGMLAAEPAEAPRAAIAAFEVSFATHVGEGAAGDKRFMRNGCYQVESGGSTGGAGHARDSQAGCHLPGDVAAVFAKLAAVPADALAREGAAPDAATRGAPARRLSAGDSRTQVVLIRSDGSRWVAANEATATTLVAAINELPSENQWYAKPPVKPVGAGPQLVVLSVVASSSGGSRRTQASLAADGRWWCYRSVVGERGGESKLPAKKTAALADAPARLSPILAGVNRAARDDDQASPEKRSDENETSVEVAWPGRDRSPLRPGSLAKTVAGRFGAEMRALSPTCATATATAPESR